LDVKTKIEFLPHTPGVYRFFNSEGTVIYVGKAKDLKRRVSQYFAPPETLNTKTRVMVSKIADMQYTEVASEQDALLLENNLIKQLQPRYNILLKDSKTYPWLCIKNEPFPRIYLTRRFVRDGSSYFGPYSNVAHAHNLIDLVNNLYKIRNCKLSLTDVNIKSGKFRPCLNYHLGKCGAPCVGLVSDAEYGLQIEAIKGMLKGGVSDMIKDFKRQMSEAAFVLDFEKAQEYKEKVEMLAKHYAKSLIVGQGDIDADVFSITNDSDDYYCNFLRIKGSCIIQSFNMELHSRIEESDGDILALFIGEIISKFGELSKEVIVPFIPEGDFGEVNVHVPLRGDKVALLELSRKNAAALKFDRMKQEEHLRPEEHKERLVANLKKDLGMSVEPRHIECFDNSNIQGTDPVAACVVFRDCVPSKKDYRHFNVKSVVGANDYASMKEIVNRRYSRMLREGEDLPQLIVIDGGKGQLGCAMEALNELGLSGKIFIVGLAERLEDIYIPGDPHPLFLDKNSSSLRVLMQIRDEAHRFGITFHRDKRSKRQVKSALSEIPGVGPATEEKLLKTFKSVKRIKEAPYENLVKVVGPSLAAKIRKSLEE